MRWRTLVLVLASALLLNGTAFATQFVRTKGTGFTLDGKPFFVTGVNNHYLTSGSEQEVVRVFDDAVALGANVVRTYLQPVIASLDGSVPTIWDWKSNAESSNLGVNGNYLLYWDASHHQMAINLGSNGVQKIDFLLAEAHKRQLKLIIAFLDFWAYTGGAQQMRAWYGSDDQHQFFFADPRTQADYRSWVRYIIHRVNPLTGLTYRDDPTIFSWELMNEPEAQPDRVHDLWVAEMSAFVKSLDGNHLVSSGQDRLNMAEFADPSIGFVTWHGYPLYYKLTPDRFNALIEDYCGLAKAHDKPVLLEEFGYSRSQPDQSEVYQMWLDTIRSNPDCAGWVVWRLVSRQDSGRFPVDEYDRFDIHNDGDQTWLALSDAARKGR